jgi:hypothetical protein
MNEIPINISMLWRSTDSKTWDQVVEERYWSLIKPENIVLERSLEPLNLSRLGKFNQMEWYSFLKDEYFRWKYTADNRYASTTKAFRRYRDEDRLDELDQIRKRLLSLDSKDVRAGLEVAYEIHGLGPAGASGLLSLMYPETFGTVDQFVVKELRKLDDLPEARTLTEMKPESLTISNGVLLIEIMQRKASENNHAFGVTTWTPRKIDEVLWSTAPRQRSKGTRRPC